MEVIDLLRAAELFYGLDDDQLWKLAAITQEITFNDNEIIFAQGDEGDRLYIVREGQIQVEVSHKNALRSQIYLGEGQVVGEMALLDYGKRSATVSSIRNNTILGTIQRDDFLTLCENDKALGYVIMHNLARDLSFKLRHRNLDPNAD